MPLLLATATATGLTLGAKLLIGFGSGGTALGIGAGLYAYFLGSQGKDDEDKKEQLKKEAKERREKREKHLDNIVDNTHNHTTHLRQRHHTHVHQITQATTALAAGSALWNQEAQQLQEVVSQVRAVVEEKERQLQQISHQLQTQVNALPTVSTQLTESQWLLTERQNDLAAMIDLLRPLLQQLEARNNDWRDLMQRIQKLEATNSTNIHSLARAGQHQAELMTEVNRLQSELNVAMGVIKQLEVTKKAYREKLESLASDQQSTGKPEHVPANPRFFNTKNLVINATGEDYHAATETINGKTRV